MNNLLFDRQLVIIFIVVLEDCDITFELKEKDLRLTVTANIVTQNINIKTNFICETESPFDEFSCTIYIPSLTLAQIFVEMLKPEFQEIVQNKLVPHLSDKVKNSGVKDLEIQFTYSDNRLSRQEKCFQNFVNSTLFLKLTTSFFKI